MPPDESATPRQEIILYSNPDGAVRLEVLFEGETFWMTQKKMSELFRVNLRTINEHLKNIYATAELQELATIRKNRIVQTEGTRSVSRELEFYNLDAIIAVGFRVNSTRAIQFRQWATGVLRDYAIRGYVLGFGNDIIERAPPVGSLGIKNPIADHESHGTRPGADPGKSPSNRQPHLG